jgi:hypothetical protein
MKRYTVTVQIQVFAENEWIAKDKGLDRLYEMMQEDKSWCCPINLDADVVEEK